MARVLTIEAKTFDELLGAGGSINYAKEMARLLIGKRKYTLPSLLMGALDQISKSKSELENNLLALAELKQFLTEKLGKNSVLLMPTHPRKPPLLNSTYTRPFDFIMTGIINALGFPATAVPMGLDKNGLPLSLQVVAAENQDHLCLSVAQMLELGFGGYKAPTRTI
jgi:fatty acid amide hydrolase 2